MTTLTQKVAITRPDGGVSIMAFVIEGRGPVLPDGAVWFSDGTWVREADDKNIASEVRRSMPDAVSWRRITDDEIPSDRTYRDALVDSGALTHSIERAREIQRNILRHERAGEFPELDALWMRAIATGDTKAAADIEAKRQALRDAPADPRIDAAVSIAELTAVQLPK